jgi:Glyoxalase-like domain
MWTGNLPESSPGYRWIAPTPTGSIVSGPSSLTLEFKNELARAPLAHASSSSNPQAGTGIAISFQWVPEPKRSKNRLHLDPIATQGLERVSRLVEQVGGSRSQRGDFDEHGWKWRLMADPEGNEFCLVPADDGPRV